MTTQNIEQLRKEVDAIWNLQNALVNSFIQLCASSNRASGALSMAENFCPEVYLNSAKKELANIEEVIKRYHENKPQEYEGK